MNIKRMSKLLESLYNITDERRESFNMVSWYTCVFGEYCHYIKKDAHDFILEVSGCRMEDCALAEYFGINQEDAYEIFIFHRTSIETAIRKIETLIHDEGYNIERSYY